MSHVTWIEHQRITILKHFPPCTLILSVSRVLPTRNTISDSIWKLCHYLCHRSSKGAFEHWAYRLHTAKLYPMSSAAIQGHSGYQATAGTSSLALPQMLHLELHSTLWLLCTALWSAAPSLLLQRSGFQLPETARHPTPHPQQVLFWFQKSHLNTKAINWHQMF